MYTCAKHFQELLEAREQECIRLRRQLKELKSTASLRQLLKNSENSAHLYQMLGFFFHLCTVNVAFISWVPVLPSTLDPEATPPPPQRKPATAGGLLECRKRDENKLIKNLITGPAEASLVHVFSNISLILAIWALLGLREASVHIIETHIVVS